jgi:hypothetical protein
MLDHSYTTVGGHLSSTGTSVIATEGESFGGVKVAGRAAVVEPVRGT